MWYLVVIMYSNDTVKTFEFQNEKQCVDNQTMVTEEAYKSHLNTVSICVPK